MATVSDEGSANVGAIKVLNQDTKAYCHQNHLTYNDEFYEIELE